MRKRFEVDFTSDNITSVRPDILEAIARENAGTATPYGEDKLSHELQSFYSELFETKVSVFPMSSGTASNALALAALSPPYGSIYCYEAAHVQTSEGGATEFFSGGAKLIPLKGMHGKLQAAVLEKELFGKTRQHNKSQLSAVSVTQATELGTIYRPEELRSITAIAARAGLRVHMDGARFSNALATVGCSPADMTWRAGVDVMSFGTTKNGGLSADCIVSFSPAISEQIKFRLRRCGQRPAKLRFAAAQLLAYATNNAHVISAAHANRLAVRFAEGLKRFPSARLLTEVEANIVFAELPEAVIEGLIEDGFHFHRWTSNTIRLVFGFNGKSEDVDDFLVALSRRLMQTGEPLTA